MSDAEPGVFGSVPEWRAYVLAGILGSEVSLILNRAAGILTLLIEDRMEAQCLLSEQETRLMSALLEVLPGPCSYARTYAAVTEVPTDQADYLFTDVDEEVRPLVLAVLRPVLQRCRSRLLAFNLRIEHVQDIGYQLVRL